MYMLNFEKKFAINRCDKLKNFLSEKKTITPLKVKWSFPYKKFVNLLCSFFPVWAYSIIFQAGVELA